MSVHVIVEMLIFTWLINIYYVISGFRPIFVKFYTHVGIE